MNVSATRPRQTRQFRRRVRGFLGLRAIADRLEPRMLLSDATGANSGEYTADGLALYAADDGPMAAGSRHVFDIYVVPSLHSQIRMMLDIYVADLTAEGYQVTVQNFAGSAVQMRDHLWSRWQNNKLEGALFIGDYPVCRSLPKAAV